MTKRQALNDQILRSLIALNTSYTDLRFFQLLRAAGVMDTTAEQFYEEPEVTVSRMNDAVAGLQEEQS